ncbi:uncharacterized protein EDB91DRAFT_1046467 [Suillus paluster]|uniref:uncharacterized protein n=1 Tax=Suillus paluster TaxID=48578 RepID=UPI001B86F880|nr:uncharacterized protein EDB91DRAFT_1046467 [Suillus paluster]KAG1749694.1 hypothetical protein EDB91DRAFT_1046467 [Suillus paluster]
MTFKDIFSSPNVMVQVCTRAFTDFCHNHLSIQIHHTHKSHAKEIDRVESSSGPARTHERLADSKPTIVGPRVEHKDEFTCKGGVDAGRLVNLARKGLYSTAKEMGGNVLLEEKWDCEIRHPRSQCRDQFKVTIHYSATVARSFCPDAQKPVEIQAAKGIKGLMTVIDRQPEC